MKMFFIIFSIFLEMSLYSFHADTPIIISTIPKSGSMYISQKLQFALKRPVIHSGIFFTCQVFSNESTKTTLARSKSIRLK